MAGVRARIPSLWVAATASLLTFGGAHGQEVRRAQPVSGDDQDIPTARAVPLQAFESPTPKPSHIVPTPPPAAPAPSINDNSAPLSAPPPSSSPDQVQLDYANGLYSRGGADMAAPEYEKYLSLYPTAPMLDRESALFRLGECYRKIGNVNAAKNSYDSLLLNYSIGPFIGPAAYRMGDICYAAKDYDGAVNYYRKASVRLTDPTVVLAAKFYCARSLEAMKLPSEARVTYEDIVDTKGDNPYREPSRLSLAQILSNYGRKQEALEQFEALAKEATAPLVKVQALVSAGLLNIELGQPQKGADDLNKALTYPEIGDLKPVAQVGLFHVLYDSEKYKEIVDQYQSGFDDLPADKKPEVLVLAANSKRQMGDFAGASDLYQQIVKDYPSSDYADEAKYQHLVSLYNAGAPDLIPAIDTFLAGHVEKGRKDQVTLIKAEALFEDHKYDEAAPVYASLQDSTLNSSFRSDALVKLAWCYMQVHQPDQAIDALTTFIKDYPLNELVPSVLAQRAVAYQQTKNLNAALKDFDRLLHDYPKAKERELALKEKALLLGEQEDNAGMAATFRQLLQEYPHTSAAAEANYWIGWSAFSAKDYKACIKPLEAARKLDKAQFFERATARIIAAYFTLEDRDSLSKEVDAYNGSNPQDKVQPDVLRWLGSEYLKAKDDASAEKYLVQLTGRDQVTAEDWLDLGRAQLGQKKYQDAIGSINKYLDPQTDPAAKAKGFLVLGRAQLDSANLDDAQASADKACSLQPEGLANAQGRMLSGDIQVARTDYGDAAKIFQSIAVIIDDPQVTPAALEKAYECLSKLGQNADAAKVLNELQTKYPEYKVKSGPPGAQ